ncbi:hypothetical protein JW964_03110 [candidate division KSB1 bacterium]|nr:hypothetical protein [candidate division KSB1 bacterium]
MKPRYNKRKSILARKPFFLLFSLFIILSLSIILIAVRTKAQIKALFKMNKELQEQGYYMAEFEFKMLGIAYYLDKGHYYKSLSMINQFHTQLKNKKNLVKMPDFTSKEDELAFYLNLQNPRTGAFMDDNYPLCTYHGPTENVILHLDALAGETSQPLRLKYPLKYLDEINTPEKLTAFLDDISTVGWIAAKLPQTTFHNARDILSLACDTLNYHEDDVDMVIQKNNLYHFSPEWRQTMLRWFWEHQDSVTGLWGPKSKQGKLRKKDLNNTSSIMKIFVNKQGNNIHQAFPLRYKQQLFESVLESLSEPVPGDDDPDELHEWNLKTLKSIGLLTRYLWKDASHEQKERAQSLIENFIRIKCEKYYIPSEGAFSYYPRGKHATLDGSGGFFIFKEIGALSGKKQQKLWGSPAANIMKLDSFKITALTHQDIEAIAQVEYVNSLRFYRATPIDTNLTAGVFAVLYPRKTAVPDIIELTQNMKNWIESTPQTMGNWVSKADIRSELASLNIEKAPIYKETIPIEPLNEMLQKNKEMTIIGFDILQIPRYIIVYRYMVE